VPEVEGQRNRGVEGAENEREQALVASGGDEDADRPEPLTEQVHPLGKSPEVGAPVRVQLRREPEARRHLLGPPLEQLLPRQAVAGRVQLHRREALRVVAQEAFRLGAAGVEIGPPRRVGPARSADIRPR
jgi:hypothetical protein